ncbi:MAG TPA: DivIVA domain-containing protein [Micromonosporaceae bacterium]
MSVNHRAGTNEGAGYSQPPPRRLSAEQVRSATFNRTTLGRRGISEEEVSGFLYRLAEDLGGLELELANTRAENLRLKAALREWQSQTGDRRPGGRWSSGSLPVEAVNLLSRAQRQIEAQVAETERYCRLREQEAQQRYEEIVHEARQHAQEEAERVARAYRVNAGAGYTPEGERAERTGVWLNALLRSLDALAAHVDATRHAFAVEVEKLAEPTEHHWSHRDSAPRSTMPGEGDQPYYS